MLRHRVIAAAPVRPASETWRTIVGLIADTLDRSSSIERTTVTDALGAAEPAGLMLIAGGHLERHPLTLVADPVHLEITTVSGAAALDDDENLEPVVGGASASTWVVHFPTPDPVGPTIRQLLDGVTHLTVVKPPDPASSQVKAAAPLITASGLDALRERRSP